MATDFDQFVQRMFNGAGTAANTAVQQVMQPPPPVQTAIAQAAQGLPPQLVQMIAQAAQQASQPAAQPRINPSLQQAIGQSAGPGGPTVPYRPQVQLTPEQTAAYQNLTTERQGGGSGTGIIDPKDVMQGQRAVGRGMGPGQLVSSDGRPQPPPQPVPPAQPAAPAPEEVKPYVWVEYQTNDGPVTFYIEQDRTRILPTGARVIDPTPVTDPQRLVRAYEAGATYERQSADVQAAFQTEEERLAASAAIEARQDNVTPEAPRISIQEAARQDAALPPVDQVITTEEIRAQGATNPEMAALATQLDQAGIKQIGPDQDIYVNENGGLYLGPKEEKNADSLMAQTQAEATAPTTKPVIRNEQDAEAYRKQQRDQALQRRIDETPALTTTQLRQTNPAAANRLESAGFTEIPVNMMAVENAQGQISLVPVADQAPEGMSIVTYGGASVNPATQRDAGFEGGLGSDIGYALSGVGTLANGLLEPFDKPRQATVSGVGNIALAVANVMPESWLSNDMRENQRVAEEGWDMDGDGAPDVFGGRAVWERYQSEQPMPARIVADIVFDPLNYVMGAGGLLQRAGQSVRIGNATVRTGDVIEGTEALVPVWRAAAGRALEGAGTALRAPEVLVDDILGNFFGGALESIRQTGPGGRLLTTAQRRVSEPLNEFTERISDITARARRGADELGQRNLGLDGTGRTPGDNGAGPAPGGDTIVPGVRERVISTGDGRLEVGRRAPEDIGDRTTVVTGGRQRIVSTDDEVIRPGQPRIITTGNGRIQLGRQAPDDTRTGPVQREIVDNNGRVVSRVDTPTTTLVGRDGAPVAPETATPPNVTVLPDAPVSAPARGTEQMVPAGRGLDRPFEGTSLDEDVKPNWGFLTPNDRARPNEAIRITDRAWELRAQFPEKWRQFREEYEPRARRFEMEQRGRNSVEYPRGEGYSRYQNDAVAEAAHVVDDVIPAFRRAFGDVEPLAEYRPRYTSDAPLKNKRDNELIELSVFSQKPGERNAAMSILESRARGNPDPDPKLNRPPDRNLAAQIPELQRVRNRYLDQVSGTEAAPQQRLPDATAAPTTEPAPVRNIFQAENVPEIVRDATETRIQWRANTDDGQRFGNQMRVLPDGNVYIHREDMADGEWFRIGRVGEGYLSPYTRESFIAEQLQKGGGDWATVVRDFNEPRAKEWGSLSDSRPRETGSNLPDSTLAPTPQPVGGESRLGIRDVPLDRITTYRQMARNGEDVAGVDAQMRDADFSEATANDIATNYNPNNMDPIKIRELPDGRYVVESGHSRLEGFRRRGEPDIPAQVIRGTDEEIQRTALNSNTAGTELTPTERGTTIRRLMDTGQTVDEVAASQKIKRAEVERFISTSYLPENSTVRELANNGSIRLDMASELGRSIRENIMTPAELDTFYRRVVSPNNMTPKQVREAIIDHAQRKERRGTESTALFGDDALGGSGFVESMNARVALRKERASLVTRENAYKRVEANSGLTRRQVTDRNKIRARMAEIDDELSLDRESQFVPTDAPAAPAPATTLGDVLRPMTAEDSAAIAARESTPDVPERSAADVMRDSGSSALFADATARPRILAADAAGRTRNALNPNRPVRVKIPPKPGDRFVGRDTTPWRTVRGRDVYGTEMRGLSYQFEDGTTLLDRWTQIADDLETNGIGKGKKKQTFTAAEAETEATKRVFDEYAVDLLQREDKKRYAIYQQEMERIAGLKKKTDPVAARAQAVALAMKGGKKGGPNAYDTLSAIARELWLYNIARGFYYPLTQAVGNSITFMLTGNAGAVPEVFRWRNLRATYNQLQEAPRSIAHSGPEQLAAEVGFGGMREDVSRIVGRDEGVSERGREMRTARLADSLRLGRLRLPLGKLTTPFANKHIRDFANAIDGSARESLWAHTLTANIADARPAFAQMMKQQLPKNMTEAQFDAIYDALPPVFGADRIRDAFEEANSVFARRIAGDWQNSLRRMDDNARQEVRRVLFSGEETNIDAALRRVFFFHYWMSRATPLYMGSLMKNPGVLNAYAKMIEETQEQDESGRYGDTVGGFLKIMDSVHGFNIFIRPDAWFQTAYSFYEQGGFTPEGESKVGEFLRKSPFMMNPLMETVVNLSGAMGDTWAPDPLTLGMWNRLVATGIDAVRSRTSDNATPTGNAWDSFSSLFRSKTSGIIPGTEKIDYEESLRGTREVNFLIQDVAEEQGLDPIGVEAMAAREDPSHPLYQEAFRRYADANGMISLARILPTSVLYPRIRLDRPDRINYEIDQLPEGDPARDPLLDQRTAASFNDPEALRLFQQQEEYASLGTPEEQAAWETYTNIRYGGLEAPVRINGVMVSDSTLRRATDDQRNAAADAWAQQTGNAERIASVQAQRKAYRESHPELAEYTDWANSVRDYEGGVQGYWEDTAEGNDNARRYLESIDEPMTLADLEQELTNARAYHAWRGARATVFDPSPISVRNDQVPYAAGEAGGGNGPGQWEQDPVKRIEQNLAEYQMDMAMYRQAAAQVLGADINIEGLNPMDRRATEQILQSAGVAPPRLSGDSRDYLDWARQQPPNGDRSVAAFIAWRDQFMQQTNPGGYDLDTLLQTVGQ